MPVVVEHAGPVVAGIQSDERLYLTADHKVVGEDDPSRRTLLVSAGGTVTDDDLRGIGLTPEQIAAVKAQIAEYGKPQEDKKKDKDSK